MDEPTSALTESEVEQLFRIIARLREQGVTIIYISHKMNEVFRNADRITVLRDGKVVQTVERTQTTPREITHLMVGRDVGASDYGANRQPGETVLRVTDLALPWRDHALPWRDHARQWRDHARQWRDHARQWRLKDISFDVRRGEVIGFAGLMGAWRTELLECLYGASAEPPLGRIEGASPGSCRVTGASAARLIFGVCMSFSIGPVRIGNEAETCGILHSPYSSLREVTVHRPTNLIPCSPRDFRTRVLQCVKFGLAAILVESCTT